MYLSHLKLYNKLSDSQTKNWYFFGVSFQCVFDFIRIGLLTVTCVIRASDKTTVVYTL